MVIGIEAQRIFRRNPHGMDVFAIGLIKALLDCDEIQKLVVLVNAKDSENDVLPEHEKLELVCFSSPYWLWEQIWLPRKLKGYALDLIHFTSNTSSLRIHLPKITTLHDIIFMKNHPMLKSGYTWYQRFGNSYRRWNVRKLFEEKSKLITVSQAEAQVIQEFTGQKVDFIHNGFSELFTLLTENQLSTFREERQLVKPFIMHIGNSDPKKNTPRTIRALVEFAKINTDIDIVLIDFSLSKVQNLLSQKDRFFLDRVHCFGYVPQQEMPFFYNSATAFVYSSIAESFGIPIAEALACGTAVIASDIPALREIGGPHVTFVRPESSEDIKVALLEVVSNQELEADREQRNVWATKHYSWNACAQSYLKVYKSLC